MVEEFKKNGFLVLKNFFSPDEIEKLLRSAIYPFKRQIQHNEIDSKKNLDLRKLRDIETGMFVLFDELPDVFASTATIAQQCYELYKLNTDKKITNLLSEIGLEEPSVCGKPCLFFNSPHLATTTGHYMTPVHQDWYSMQGSLDSIVLWAPLVEVNKDIGALKIIPASHKQGVFKAEKDDWYSRIASTEYSEDDFITAEMGIGDLLIFNSFLVHSSGQNITNRARWSIQLRFNNLAEETFIQRGYPYPYSHRPTLDRLYDRGFEKWMKEN